MASEVKTNKISPATGTDVTLGDASDTFTVPSGSAITVASGGDINVLSGGEIDIASSATLDVNGTIDLTGATTTGFPAGGLTTASQWRLTTDFTGDQSPISSNLEEVDAPVGFGVLGSSITQASGIFTFPSTGYWFITYHHMLDPSTVQTANTSIHTTTNNSTYVLASHAYQTGYYEQGTSSCSYMMDVTSTTTHKVRFHIVWSASAASQTTNGDTAYNETYMTFLRLADT